MTRPLPLFFMSGSHIHRRTSSPGSMGGLHDLLILVSTSLQAYRYCVIALFVLQIYEWSLLLDEEIHLIHRARWTSIKIAYLFCRYYPLLSWPVFVWAIVGNHEPHVCKPFVHVIYAFIVLMQVSTQAVMLIRTYAFTGRKKSVLVILLANFLALLGVQIWTFTADIHSASPMLHPLVGNTACLRVQNNLPKHIIIRTAMILYSSFFFDVLCVSVVAIHCFVVQTWHGRLGETFLKQGMIGFVAMTIGNLFAASENVRPIHKIYGLSLTFSLIINNIIACRLILHLRRSVTQTETEGLIEQSRVVRKALDALDGSEDDVVDHWVYPSSLSSSS